MDRRPGSRRCRMATTEENEKMIEELICSQGENPESYISPREIENYTGISRFSVRRMVKKKGLK